MTAPLLSLLHAARGGAGGNPGLSGGMGALPPPPNPGGTPGIFLAR
ncbi:hypothetical protein ABIE58_003677 [Roseovarius sp. MBR-78]